MADRMGLDPLLKRRLDDALRQALADLYTPKTQPATMPLVLWREGRRVSGPGAWITDPPPPMLSIAGPQVFRSLEEVVEHLTSEPTADRFVLQYVASEPRAAVYLYAPEALAQMESA